MANMIWVKLQKVGFHCFPDAPEEVAYLRNKHRHMFHFKVWIEVLHDNRDIEFHMFRQFVDQLMGNEPIQFGPRSCEKIADELQTRIAAAYPDRVIWVEVSEDDENGVQKKYAA